MGRLTMLSELPRGTAHPLDVLTERPVDVRLVAAAVTSVGLEPGYDVRVEPDRNLPLHRSVEYLAPGIGPVENLRRIGRVDLERSIFAILRACILVHRAMA